MAEYQFLGVVEQNDTSYFVKFPDVESCFAEGRTLSEAINLAEESLGVYLAFCEDEKKEIPRPAQTGDLDLKNNEQLVLVHIHTDLFREIS
ncbi:type II toxin-antitoxin system HicB family antitoxin [Peribacillus kribbensis]|uniref:type II toxin-antitoxin system HicB family antitoxin n=1 Tax=Peribacillus kribbensis TaxID=356658 RepID=UPI00047AA871|nr:type II toxin-antitoxin system HicB family antitoxin [Peribacillus kribbensis]